MLVGCGGFAGYHARRLAECADVSLVACVDLSQPIVAAFMSKHIPALTPVPAIETNLAAALAKHRPNAVVVATPHTLHFAQAMAALEADCHVFVEKPMVTSSRDAAALAAAVERAGKVLVVGYNTSCTPEFDYLRRVIRNPDGPIGLGRLQLVTGSVSQNWMHWTTGSWRQNPALSGGGMTYDTGAHMLNSLCWSVDSRVKQVFAMVDSLDTPVDINSAISIRFENGVMATLAISGNCPSESSRMTYLFTGGRIEIDGWYGGWIEVHNAYGRVKYPKVNTDLRGQTGLDNFIDAVLGRDTPRTTAKYGVIQSELMDMVYESAITGAAISRT